LAGDAWQDADLVFRLAISFVVDVSTPSIPPGKVSRGAEAPVLHASDAVWGSDQRSRVGPEKCPRTDVTGLHAELAGLRLAPW